MSLAENIVTLATGLAALGTATVTFLTARRRSARKVVNATLELRIEKNRIMLSQARDVLEVLKESIDRSAVTQQQAIAILDVVQTYLSSSSHEEQTIEGES